MNRANLSLCLTLISCVGFSGCNSNDDTTIVSSVPSDPLSVPYRKPEFVAVTNAYGPLVVKAGEFSVESKTKPWSSWWFPIKDTYLFQSHGSELSPLQKYDLYAKNKLGRDTHAAQFEKEKIYDPDAAGWEGLCDAWSVASIRVPEPTHPVTAGGITFGVGDLKALLVKTFDAVEGKHLLGQRFMGDRDSVFEDIYPDQFHRYLQAQLFDKGQPFVMDKDPGVAVWNTPIWKAEVKVERDLASNNKVHVQTWLYGAGVSVDTYDFIGTDEVTFQYTYDLIGFWSPDGSFHAEFGEWTGESKDYHPDFITVVPEKLVRKGRNTEIDPAIVDKIILGQ